MKQYHELLAPTRSEKSGTLIWTPSSADNEHECGVLTIMGLQCYDVFDVEEFPCDHGRGFALFKVAPDWNRYSVHCGSDGIRRCECEEFFSTVSCKHLSALDALPSNGWIRTSR